MRVFAPILALATWCCVATRGNGFQSCPVVPTDQVSVCVDYCSDDVDCEGDQLCCSSGCGHNCVDPVTVPYYEPPLQCPDAQGYLTSSDCTQSCNRDSECGSGELCCPLDCGVMCVEGVLPSSLCSAMRDTLNGSLIGAYVPQCEDDGRFSPMQCHASLGHCWCVNTQTGEPLGGLFRLQSDGPMCANCTYFGEVYFVGDEFPANDGCNNCVCQSGGTVMCSNLPVPCSATDPVPTESEDQFLSCPPVEGDVVGLCVESCSADTDCLQGQMCCSNGCGHSCVRAVEVPYLPPTLSCPNPEELLGICDLPSCKETGCSDGLLCCPNPCGSMVCEEGVTDQLPCLAIQRKVSNSSLLGGYVPKCDANGRYQAMQCHSHYCWCVDPDTGKPQSEIVTSTDVGSLQCTGSCPIEGQIYLECGGCPQTCATVDQALACAQLCTSGCQCYSGTVLDEERGMCVLPQDCSTGTQCVYGGETYESGQEFGGSDGCGGCFCEDGVVACADTECVGTSGSDLKWWHNTLIASGAMIAVLAIVVVVLIVAVIVVIRHNQFSHRRLKEVNYAIVDEVDAVGFKEPEASGNPEHASDPVKA